MNALKLWRRVQAGQHAGIAFADLIRLVEASGCLYDRTRGSHRY